MSTLATHRAPRWRSSAGVREGELWVEPSNRCYRLYTTKSRASSSSPIMESQAAFLVWEPASGSPLLAFRKSQVKWWSSEKSKEPGLVESSKGHQGPSKLASQYFDLVMPDGSRIESVAWTYNDSTPITNKGSFPSPEDSPLPSDLISLQTSKFPSAWEEDSPILDHVVNPYHRVDALPSSRSVQIYALEKSGKEVLIVDTRKSKGGTIALFETGLATRWYLPADAFQVNGPGQASMHPPPACGLKEYPSDGLQTVCPYKGFARYHSLTLPDNGDVLPDIAWAYPENIPALDIRGLVCLWTPGNTRLKLVVDGQQV